VWCGLRQARLAWFCGPAAVGRARTVRLGCARVWAYWPFENKKSFFYFYLISFNFKLQKFISLHQSSKNYETSPVGFMIL
jgi:hypothetical protein